jgi:hypothetical protein
MLMIVDGDTSKYNTKGHYKFLLLKDIPSAREGKKVDSNESFGSRWNYVC